jgi:D-alanyl-D-alanine carboxypeptidase (penicillin-binding protein 5/6)
MKDHRHDISTLYSCLVMGLVGLIIFITFPQTISKISAEEVATDTQTAKAIQIKPKPKPSVNPLNEIILNAKAAFVYDVTDQKVLFQKNAEVALPLASLTKIMTAITATEIALPGTVVTIDKNSLLQQGDSGLLDGERWTLEDLLKYTLVVSSNDGADAVAEALGSHDISADPKSSIATFVSYMNVKAKQISLKNTVFLNPTGLDESTLQAGAYGSARDTAFLLLYAITYHSSIFEPTRFSTFKINSIENIPHSGINTNILADKIPNLIAGKTGNSDLAGGNLAVVFDTAAKHRMIIVVLGSTYDGRFTDTSKLINTFNKISVNNQ